MTQNNQLIKIIERYEKGEIEEVNISVTTYYGVVFHDGTVGTITKAYVVFDDKEIEIDEKIAKKLINELDEIGFEKSVKMLKEYIKKEYGREVNDDDIEIGDDSNPYYIVDDKVIVAYYNEYDRIVITGRESEYYTYYQPRIVIG